MERLLAAERLSIRFLRQTLLSGSIGTEDLVILIRQIGTFNDAISILRNLYVKPINEVYNRHKLTTTCHQPEESVDQYLQVLNLLTKDCNFKAVIVEKHRGDFVTEAFIRGLSASHVRQRLFENLVLTLNEAYEKSLELAHHQAQFYK